MTKVAVILSGCGFIDGAEIRESVLSLLYLDQQGAEVEIFAPDAEQMHVVNHAKGEEAPGQRRNIMEESARIARGDIAALTTLNPDDFDALIIPGGFGVAKNLSDFASKGAQAAVLPAFAEIIRCFYQQQKPIGAICIAPAVVALALKGIATPTLTIGDDEATAAAIHATGATHQQCATDSFVYDASTRIASCPAYMREDNIAAIARGIEQLVQQVLKIAAEQANQRAA
jgi:enhancing lycopene biosynthesis protein 2